MLAASALILFTRPSADLIPASSPLELVPGTIGGWSGNELQIDPDTLRVLGKGSSSPASIRKLGSHRQFGLFVAISRPKGRESQFTHQRTACRAPDGRLSGRIMSISRTRRARGTGWVSTLSPMEKNRQFIIYWYERMGEASPMNTLAKITWSLTQCG